MQFRLRVGIGLVYFTNVASLWWMLSQPQHASVVCFKKRKNRIRDMPFLTFIEVNLPLTPTIPPIERSWVREAMRCFEERKHDGYVETDSGLVMTNIAWHYHRDVGPPPGEAVTVKPETPLFPIRSETWALLDQALNEYGLLVDEESAPPRIQIRELCRGGTGTVIS